MYSFVFGLKCKPQHFDYISIVQWIRFLFSQTSCNVRCFGRKIISEIPFQKKHNSIFPADPSDIVVPKLITFERSDHYSFAKKIELRLSDWEVTDSYSVTAYFVSALLRVNLPITYFINGFQKRTTSELIILKVNRSTGFENFEKYFWESELSIKIQWFKNSVWKVFL